MKYMKHYGEKFNMFKSIIKKNNPVIIEIGAHYGEDTLRFLETFKNPMIYCFEPDPRNITIFKKHVKVPNIILLEFALSNFDGKAEFFQSYDEAGHFSVPSKYDWINLEDYRNNKLSNSGSSSLKCGYTKILKESIEVATKRFDTWYKENNIGVIDLAWIDVQGAEKDVLLGMGEEMDKIKHIWIEYGEKDYEDAMSRRETINLLESKGYQVISSISSFSETGDLMFRRAE